MVPLKLKVTDADATGCSLKSVTRTNKLSGVAATTTEFTSWLESGVTTTGVNGSDPAKSTDEPVGMMIL